MSSHVIPWLLGKKWILAIMGALILMAAWWLFRPEKLWVNVRVNEPAPFGTSANLQPLYTGALTGRAHPTSGRASVYQMSNGKRDLRLTDFMTSNGPDVRVLLAQSTDEKLKQDFVKGELTSLELGSMKANQGDQTYDVPDSADLTKYDEVVIYCQRFHVVFGLAKLEKF